MNQKTSFENLTIIEKLFELLQLNFLANSIYRLVETEPLSSPLLVINHKNHYLSLSNETHYIILLPLIREEIIAEVRDLLPYIPTRKKIVVQLEQNTILPGLESQNIGIDMIRQEVLKNGVGVNNLFLKLLEEMFQFYGGAGFGLSGGGAHAHGIYGRHPT